MGLPIPVSDPQPCPRSEWPAWALWLAERRQDGERGVGDTLERLLGEGGRAFKRLWKATFEQVGLGCGCDGRRERWNTRYPYSNVSTLPPPHYRINLT